MNNDELFPTQQEKDQAVMHLNDLRNHPGYQILCRIMDANIDFLKLRLTDEDFDDFQQQKDVKKLKEAYENVRNTVDNLIAQFTQTPVHQDTGMGQFDPYEQAKPMFPELEEPKG
jgi:hypothetical protein